MMYVSVCVKRWKRCVRKSEVVTEVFTSWYYEAGSVGAVPSPIYTHLYSSACKNLFVLSNFVCFFIFIIIIYYFYYYLFPSPRLYLIISTLIYYYYIYTYIMSVIFLLEFTIIIRQCYDYYNIMM